MQYKLICITLVLSVILILPQAGFCRGEPKELTGLKEFMERGMADWGIPGMAVAVVKDGEIIYAGGFGLRKLGSDERVDQHTVFGVASLTKAMTSAAIGILVDEGKLDWDDRVRDHLPWFELSDPWVSENVTIRDLLSHKVGIGRLTGNRLRFMPGRDPQTIMSFVRHMPFEQTFRSGYVYSNIMYMVAGQVVEAASGMRWDDFIAGRIFAPLGMESANTSVAQIGEYDNAAWPHQEIDGVVQPIPRRNFDNVGPSASVNSSVTDMARWMLLQLGEPGEYEGERIVSRESILETHQPQQVFRVSDPLTSPLTGYGLGWGLGYYEGYRVSQHSGATDGMTSSMVLVPEKDLGVIVASNLFCNFRPAVVNYILDAMLGKDRETDWHTHYYEQYLEDKAEAIARRGEIESRRQEDAGPSLPPEAYTGHYHHKVYDNAEVRLRDDGTLEMQLWGDDEMIARLEHWHYDTFRAHWQNSSMREKFVSFDIDQYGEVHRLNVRFTLRQVLISVGIYPANYYRMVDYTK